MGEKTLEHATYKIGYHVVWCTKFRHPILVNAVEVFTKNTIAQTCAVYGWKLKQIEIMPDHVHCFISAPPTVAPTDIVKTLKSVSAIAVFTQFPQLKGQKFWGSGLWSKSYYVGTVGDMSEKVVLKYIGTQKPR